MSKLNRIAILITLFALTVFGTFQITTHLYNHQIEVIYNLEERHNDQVLIKMINYSNRYVYFAIYYFTKDNIADALIRAKQRGLVVWGITDSTQAQNPYEQPIVQKLRDAGITVETQKHADGIMHIKAIVTDKAYAMGSYNWTESATTANDELLEVGTNKYLHDRYLVILQKLLVVNQ